MKIPIKKKDFEDKATLEKSLGTKLKKPVSALVKKTVDKLPFCYEVDYFSEGKGFMSIGVAKEVDKLFKTKRVKGQGTKGKIDKKKVAYGHVSINAEGVFEFCVLGGMMKGMQAKKVIKSIGILKKMIGDNFVIVKGAAPVEEAVETEAKTDAPQKEKQKKEGEKDNKKAATAALVAEIKTLIKSIGGSMKKDIAATIVPKIKSKQVTDKELNRSSEILDDIKKLKELYDSAEEKVKSAFGKHVDKIKTFEPQVNKIKAAIEKILPTIADVVEDVVDAVEDVVEDVVDAVEDVVDAAKDVVEDIQENPNDKWFSDLIDSAKKFKDEFSTSLDEIEESAKAAAKAAKKAVKKGADFITDLF